MAGRSARASYRLGDSVADIVTPMTSYFPRVTFARAPESHGLDSHGVNGVNRGTSVVLR